MNASSDAAGPGIAARFLDRVPFLRTATFTSSGTGVCHILGGITHGRGWGYMRSAILKPGRSLDVYLRGLRYLTVFRQPSETFSQSAAYD